MTWRLLVGQLRAHRGYFAWTVTLLGLLAATLTYVVVAGATQAVINARQAAITGQDLDRSGWVVVTADPTGIDNAVTPEQLREMVDSTPSAFATASGVLATSIVGEFEDPGSAVFWALAAYDNQHMQRLVTAGRVPQSQGEIALAANVAHDAQTGVGDDITLYTGRSGDEGYTVIDVLATFTVVGLTTSQNLAGYDVYQVPSAIVSWDETESRGALVDTRAFGDEPPVTASFVDLHWDGSSPLLDPFLQYEGGYRGQGVEPPQSTSVWITLALVLVAAMIIMSFAVGRAQAAARTQWIATARTLGATRRYIAWSTVLETLFIALVAMGIGAVAGIVAAQAHLSIARAAAESAIAPDRVSLHWAIIPTVAGATLLVAVAIAAVPAFWASRVEPVAALKPINDISEAELSRRVSPHWLWIPTGLGIAFIVIGNWNPTFPDGAIIVLGLLIASAGIIGLVVEAARWAIPWIGRRMSRSSRATILVAGDTLAGRPRLAVAPALISLAAVGGFTLFTFARAYSAQWQAGDFGWYAYAPVSVQLVSPGVLDGATALAVTLGAVMVQLVAAAIFVAHRSGTVRETAALRALGLSRAAQMRAQWWQQFAPQAMGAALGVIFGTAIFGLWSALQAFIDEGYVALGGGFAAWAIAASVTAATVLLLTAAATAWLVGRMGRSATPLSQLAAQG